MKKLLVSIIAGAAILFAGCSSSDDPIMAPAQAQAGANRVQVEFLGRPAVGEGLLFTNSNLNTYNAVTPAFISRALTVPAGPEAAAANATLTEAQAVLTILTNAGGGAPLTTAGAVAAFLPDVLRIDTTRNLAVADVAYASAQSPLNANGSPAGGRKLTDDVIDITLATLSNGAVTTDNVPYYRGASPNLNIGHQRLNGQTVDFGAATFPFLAPAN